jgi:hypothetical protein
MQINKNKQLGLWCGQRLNSLWCSLITLVVIAGSIRGIIVINSDISTRTVYLTTAAALLMLAIYGYLKRGAYKDASLVLLKTLLKLNMLLGIVNVAIDLFLGAPFELSMFYIYLPPYIIFLLLRMPTFYLNVAITIVSIAISYSVFDNFMETMKGPAGYANVSAYNLKLRPDLFEGLSHTGEFYRAAGYTGSYHDSANILGMAVSFFFIRFLLSRKMLDLGLSLFAMLSLTLTQSAANIVAAIFTLVIFTGYALYRNRKTSSYVYFLLGVIGIILLIMVFGDVMSIFTERVGGGGDWEGMTTHLDKNSLLSSVPFMLIGHAAAFSSKASDVEISHLKIVYQLGIIHAAILFWILLYPVIRFVKIRLINLDALPSVAAIFFGFVSLLHYGSVFRVTSIFLFYSFYAMCLINIINCTRLDNRSMTAPSPHDPPD